MRRDLHVMEQICYLGEQEWMQSQAPLHSASPRGPVRDRDKYAALPRQEHGVLRAAVIPLRFAAGTQARTRDQEKLEVVRCTKTLNERVAALLMFSSQDMDSSGRTIRRATLRNLSLHL